MRVLIFLIALKTFSAPLFVSLGSHCEPCVMLRHFNFRKIAYPFDWLVTIDHKGFVSILEEDFSGFLDKENLFSFLDHSTVIQDSHYNIEFKHDGSLLLKEEDFQLAKEKYAKRISRFRELRNYPGKVYFIRVAYDLPEGGPTYWLVEPTIQREDAFALKEALDNYFPKLDFSLLILNYLEDLPEPIGEIPGVIEYKIRKKQKHSDYKALFDAISSFTN